MGLSIVWPGVALGGTGKLIGGRTSVRIEWEKLVAIGVRFGWLGELTWRLVSSSFMVTASKFHPGEGSTCEVDTLPFSLSQAAKLSDDSVGAAGMGECCSPLSDGVTLALLLADLDLRPLFLVSRLYWQRHPTAGRIFRTIILKVNKR